MRERYLRNLGALSEGECETLLAKKVFVAGCGGLGGHIIDMLLRVGVGGMVAADGDVFEVSNLNRQLLSDMTVIGKNKAAVAKAYARRINPDVDFVAIEDFIDDRNVKDMIRGCDIVMDALDNIPARRRLAGACEAAGIPYVYGAICAWVAQAAIALPGDGLLERLYPEGAALNDKSSLAFTPALCASMQAALCTQYLCGRAVESGKLYFFDMLDFDFQVIGI